MESVGTANIFLSLTFAGLLFYKWPSLKWHLSGHPTPPQPRGWPLVGNLGMMPKVQGWLKFIEWGKELNSDIVYTNVAGKTFLVLNSFEAAQDLLDKRSGIYSDRTPSVLFDKLWGWDYLLSRLPYGERWRTNRKIFHKHLRPAQSSMYRPKIVSSLRRAMVQFSLRPTDIDNVLRHTIGGFAISMAYGLPTHPFNDPHVDFATKAILPLATVATPGVFLVNIIPFWEYIPSWFPGGGIKHEMHKQRAIAKAFRDRPFDEALAYMASSEGNTSSFTSLALEDLSRNGEDDDGGVLMIKSLAATVFSAGSDTTSTTVMFWIRYMVAYPEIQKRLQQELDEVLQGRLPEFSDVDRLPWLSASIMESMRMRPTTPQGVPHYSNGDDTYRDYWIPDKTTVIANFWAMLYNPDVYPNPDVYNPARFLKDGKINPEVRHPKDIFFGFGRRSCPGMNIAMDVVFMFASTVLTIFDICAPLDGEGNPILPNMEDKLGVVIRPQDFDCVFKIRNDTARAVLTDIEMTYASESR